MQKPKLNDRGVDGKKVKAKRKEKGLSRLELAAKTNVGYNIIWRAEETGSDLYSSDLRKIAEELNTSVSELMLPTVVTVA